MNVALLTYYSSRHCTAESTTTILDLLQRESSFLFAVSNSNLKLPLGCSDAGPGSGETESTISSLNKRFSSSCNTLDNASCLEPNPPTVVTRLFAAKCGRIFGTEMVVIVAATSSDAAAAAAAATARSGRTRMEVVERGRRRLVLPAYVLRRTNKYIHIVNSAITCWNSALDDIKQPWMGVRCACTNV